MKTIKIIRVLEYLLVACIILEFNTVYTALPLVRRAVQILPMLLIVLLIMMSRRPLSKGMVTLVSLYYIGAVFPIFSIQSNAYMSYAKSYIIILPLLWIYLMKRKRSGNFDYISLFLRFSNVMAVLAIISITMWLLGSVLQVIAPTSWFLYTWTGTPLLIPSYFNIYFETQSVFIQNLQVLRNSGIFNEAPMHNMALCAALAVECFVRPYKSKKRIIILVATILSTLTTTGQLFLLMLAAWFLFKRTGRRYRALIIVSAPILLVAVYMVGTMLVDTKIKQGGEGSVDLRSEDIRYCMEAGMENPLFGVGIAQKDDISKWRGVQLGRSNSLFAVFARGGLYFLTLYLGSLLIIPLLYYQRNRSSDWLLVMLCYLGLFAITICFTNYLTFLFMALGLSYIDMRKQT